MSYLEESFVTLCVALVLTGAHYIWLGLASVQYSDRWVNTN